MNFEQTTPLSTRAPKTARWAFDLFNRQKIHPLYDKSVKNKVTGDNYVLSHDDRIGQKTNGFFKILDIPEYLMTEPKLLPKNFGLITIQQYDGFLIDLSQYKNVDDFMVQQLSKRSQKRLHKSARELNENYAITHKVFRGHITQSEHKYLLGVFASFLKKRFKEKKTFNKYLAKWGYYEELSFKKINEGAASLFVIYNGETPICLTLNFHFEDILFSELESYDIDYSQYGLGDISMRYHIKWCFDHNIQLIDLAMGKTNFKEKWCNYVYYFHHHFFYNKNNLGALVQLCFEFTKFKLWQALRNMGIVGHRFRFDKLLYKLKRQT